MARYLLDILFERLEHNVLTHVQSRSEVWDVHRGTVIITTLGRKSRLWTKGVVNSYFALKENLTTIARHGIASNALTKYTRRLTGIFHCPAYYFVPSSFSLPGEDFSAGTCSSGFGLDSCFRSVSFFFCLSSIFCHWL